MIPFSVEASPPPVPSTGTVLSVSRSQAKVLLPGSSENGGEGATVGGFLAIPKGEAVLVSVIINVCRGPADGLSQLVAEVDLLGELIPASGARSAFRRGLTVYPSVDDAVRPLSVAELDCIFAVPDDKAIRLGYLHQDASIGAKVNVGNLLTKHFAVLGTTGVGKSSGVALLLQRIAAAQPDLRTFLIDPHNEYGRCFGDKAQVLNPSNLKLPFWLFNFEEMVDVLFRARPGTEEEVAILSEVIPLAKDMYDAPRAAADLRGVRRPEVKQTAHYTVDTPVPYRLADLVSLINERMGKLENRTSAARYARLISRIETVRNDRRYAFMFDSANVGGDTMVDLVQRLFCLCPGEASTTIMQLAGFPTEVVDSVVSVVCRMAFDLGLWSDGAFPLLFVCEEAHRYAPADRSMGFGPTRKALSRIAKEGRKYGVFLGLVSQRAGELDATILSQCSTIFAMRMGNEQDQRIIRSAVSDAAANLLGFVPTLATREVFAFGEGVALPLRFFFDQLAQAALPRGEAVPQDARVSTLTGRDFLAAVVDRWRGSSAAPSKPADSAWPSLRSA